jgi:hypothetical protein
MGAITGAILGLVLFGLTASTILTWLRLRRLERAFINMVKGAQILLRECGEHTKQIASQGQLLVLVAEHVQKLQKAKGGEETVLH